MFLFLTPKIQRFLLVLPNQPGGLSALPSHGTATAVAHCCAWSILSGEDISTEPPQPLGQVSAFCVVFLQMAWGYTGNLAELGCWNHHDNSVQEIGTVLLDNRQRLSSGYLGQPSLDFMWQETIASYKTLGSLWGSREAREPNSLWFSSSTALGFWENPIKYFRVLKFSTKQDQCFP